MTRPVLALVLYAIVASFLYILVVHDIFYSGVEIGLFGGDAYTYFHHFSSQPVVLSEILDLLYHGKIGALMSLFGISYYASLLRSFSSFGIFLSIIINMGIIAYVFNSLVLFVNSCINRNKSLLLLSLYSPFPFLFLYGPNKEIITFLLIGLLLDAIRLRASYASRPFSSLIKSKKFLVFSAKYLAITFIVGLFREVNSAISILAYFSLFVFDKPLPKIGLIIFSSIVLSYLVPDTFGDLVGLSGTQQSADIRSSIFESFSGNPFFVIIFSLVTYPITLFSAFSYKSLSSLYEFEDPYILFRMLFALLNLLLFGKIARIFLFGGFRFRSLSQLSVNLLIVLVIYLLLYGMNPSSVVRQFLPVYPVIMCAFFSLNSDRKTRSLDYLPG